MVEGKTKMETRIFNSRIRIKMDSLPKIKFLPVFSMILLNIKAIINEQKKLTTKKKKQSFKSR